MVVLGKIGRVHGKKGAVKIIPAQGKHDVLSKINSAIVLLLGGEKLELENIRRYNRGRFLGTLNDFSSRSSTGSDPEFTEGNEVERFRGGIVVQKG